MNTDEIALRKEAIRRLREVIDPEIGVNIVDLGLVYQLYVADGKLVVHLTVTTPACPMGLYIEKQALAKLSALTETEIRFVMEPPWSPDMISADVPLFGLKV